MEGLTEEQMRRMLASMGATADRAQMQMEGGADLSGLLAIEPEPPSIELDGPPTIRTEREALAARGIPGVPGQMVRQAAMGAAPQAQPPKLSQMTPEQQQAVLDAAKARAQKMGMWGSAGSILGSATDLITGRKAQHVDTSGATRAADAEVKGAEDRIARAKQYVSEQMTAQRQGEQDAFDREKFGEQKRQFGAGQEAQAAARRQAVEEALRQRQFAADESQKNRDHQARQNALAREAAQKKAADKAAQYDPRLSGDLRKEFNALPEVKQFKEVAVAYDKVRRAAADPSAAGDLGLIFAYMKMLDPGSTVREGEFANAQNATGVDDRVRNIYNRAASGERLNPTQRADFVKQAQGYYAAHDAAYQPMVERYRAYAAKAGADPDDVVMGGASRPQGQPTSSVNLDAPPATVTVRRKKDGKTKPVPADQAEKYANSPDYEVL